MAPKIKLNGLFLSLFPTTDDNSTSPSRTPAPPPDAATNHDDDEASDGSASDNNASDDDAEAEEETQRALLGAETVHVGKSFGGRHRPTGGGEDGHLQEAVQDGDHDDNQGVQPRATAVGEGLAYFGQGYVPHRSRHHFR